MVIQNSSLKKRFLEAKPLNEMFFLLKLDFFNIFATWCCCCYFTLFFNRIHGLKYQRSTTLGYKDIGIRKSVLVAKTQFLRQQKSLKRELFSKRKSYFLKTFVPENPKLYFSENVSPDFFTRFFSFFTWFSPLFYLIFSSFLLDFLPFLLDFLPFILDFLPFYTWFSPLFYLIFFLFYLIFFLFYLIFFLFYLIFSPFLLDFLPFFTWFSPLFYLIFSPFYIDCKSLL